MKKISLLEAKITNSQAPKNTPLNYRNEFLRLAELVPEGITASQMGVAIKLASKLQGATTGQDLYLEDAEWEYLKKKLENAKFNFVAPEIVAMVDSVVKAEDAVAPHLTQSATS
jgi:hypothetical protein